MQTIFIHGLGQNGNSWDRTISALTRPVSPACPDLFSLLREDQITYANLYKAFSQYCGSFSEPLELCGLSLGGVLALNYAIDQPEKVSSLILIGTPYTMPKGLLAFQNILFRLMPKSVFVETGLQKNDMIGLTKSIMSLNFSEDLKKIACPALILCGEKDTANKKAAEGLAENIPGAKLRLVEDTGHEVNVDKPERLAAVISEFYGEVV